MKKMRDLAPGLREKTRRPLASAGVLMLAAAFLPTLACSSDGVRQEASGLPLDRIRLPQGFQIEIYAYPVPAARSLTLGPEGTVFVGTREDRVYALRDKDADHRAEEIRVVARGLNSPNGVAVKDGDLYVAEISRVLRFPNIENTVANPPAPEVVNDTFPSDGHHGWKFIAFGPDGKLYVPVGAPCNVCLKDEPVYAAIHRMNADGTQVELYASGIRNTVGFDWNPVTHELWFTDNGRDYLGDNAPPDELNRVAAPGMHFGFPFCHGGDIPDPEFGEGHPCSDYVPPAQKLGPHVASLGMRFYTGAMFPEAYRNQIFIAEHGSWNRSTRIGYRLSLVRLEGNKAVGYEPFAQGWLSNGSVWGRPVDVLVMPDGALLVSDDYAGAVYRISWAG
jgi:glucose/arabinose dehydrogenase